MFRVFKDLLKSKIGRDRSRRARRKAAFSWATEPLEPRLVLSPIVQSLGNGIEYTYDQGHRLSSIRVDGVEILKSGGIYLIASGSPQGRDIPETNYESILADRSGSRSGRMKNSQGDYGPPFELTFTRKDANTIVFRAKVGPVGRDFEQVSLAMDFQKKQIGRFVVPNADRMKFSYKPPEAPNWYRDGGRLRFSDIQKNLTIKNAGGKELGQVGTALTRDPEAKSEFKLIGRRVVVEVRVTKAENLKTLSFSNHFVSNTAGFSLGEPLRQGESAMVEGEITIRRR